MVSFILARTLSRAALDLATISRSMARVTQAILRSSWMAVTPFSVPATLKSMSPKWSS